MKVKSFIIIAFAGLLGLVSCKKDEDKQVLSDNPTAPTLNIPSPDLVLLKTNANDTITFNGNASDYGIKVVITYALEADTSSSFTHPVTLASASVNKFQFNTADFNTKILAMGVSEFAQANIKLRVKASVSSYAPAVYSGVSTMNITTFGTAKLVLSTGQSISSPADDGNYHGFVKFASTDHSFTLTNFATGDVYGGAANILILNGAPIAVSDSGWYELTVNTTNLTYTLTPYHIGVVGSATPNSWNSPDTKMDYDDLSGTWKVTMDLQPSLDNGVMKCEFKFRLNDDWTWNLGWNSAKTGLEHNGSNIVATAGNYTITLTITQFAAPETGTFTIVKN